MTDPMLFAEEPPPQPATSPYRVLARKYRPTTFAEMIGQDALVRTLSNALASGRLAHAFILTGVRGVGKTTTARIIARALNCIGPDGKGGPTAAPCGVCDPCRSILADRAVDVMEMDAASRTGVDDIREILDGVRYGPVACRSKVYIVDEVHMLSRNAFNALLKTLEEPPPHVTFIFATTEIRKVPVTVLSRCQRFDLRRVDADRLAAHFTGILEREGVTAEPEAIAMIARAADGSVRDGLSLLDQAIAEASTPGGRPHIVAASVRAMLGLADRGLVFDLMEALAAGDGPALLGRLREAGMAGADPVALLGDLLDLVHLLARAKLVPAVLDDPAMPEAERQRGGRLAEALSMPVLTRAWQTLLKGAGELQTAPRPDQALEMVLIRLLHMADLPSPAELIRRFGDAAATPVPAPAPMPRGGSGPFGASGELGGLRLAVTEAWPRENPPTAEAAPRAEAAPLAPPQPARPAVSRPQRFEDLVEIAFTRDIVLYGHLFSAVRPVRFEWGRFEFQPTADCPAELAQRLDRALREWTGERWIVSVVSASESAARPTLAESARSERARLFDEVRAHPTVAAILDAFPGAEIRDVRNPLGGMEDGAAADGASGSEALPPAEAYGEPAGDARDDAEEDGFDAFTFGR